MSDSVWSHRWQPTRLPRPWDSPGKNTGVGCHFLLQCIKMKVKSLSRVRLLVITWTAAHQAPPSMGFSRQEYWSGVPLPSPKFLLYRFKLYRFIINLTSAFLNLSLNWTNSVLPMSKTEKFLDFVLLLDVTAHFNIFKYFYFME